MSDGELKDARGVKIRPGDTVVYSYPVGSHGSALAEGVVMTEIETGGVSLTRTGLVRVHIIRRAFGIPWRSSRDMVAVGADRLAVVSMLPESPLPTWQERRDARKEQGQ